RRPAQLDRRRVLVWLGAVQWSWLLGHPGLVLGLEPVAHAWFGDEVAGVRRIGFQFAADLGDEQAQVVGLLLVFRPPDLLQQLPLADQPAGGAGQQLNELPLGRGEADLPAVSGDLLGGQVDAEVRGLDDRGVLLGEVGSADRGPPAGPARASPPGGWVVVS